MYELFGQLEGSAPAQFRQFGQFEGTPPGQFGQCGQFQGTAPGQFGQFEGTAPRQFGQLEGTAPRQFGQVEGTAPRQFGHSDNSRGQRPDNSDNWEGRALGKFELFGQFEGTALGHIFLHLFFYLVALSLFRLSPSSPYPRWPPLPSLLPPLFLARFLFLLLVILPSFTF